MDAIDIMEESLSELDAVLEEEGLIPLEARKLVEILEAITADEVVNTFQNLLSDPTALSDSILKLLDSAYENSGSESSSDLIVVLNALQHISTYSVKFLTPQDVRFLRDSMTDPSETDSPVAQMEQIKICKENLREETALHRSRAQNVLSRVGQLEAQAALARSAILDHVKSSDNLPACPAPPLAFTPLAETRLAQLDFDGAVQALSAEVVKLEKMLVYERSQEEEFEITTLLNDLLLSQIEAAEEGRVLSDRTAAEISSYSANLHQEHRSQQLTMALSRADEMHTSLCLGHSQAHDNFEKQSSEMSRGINSQIDHESVKLIATLRSISADTSRGLEARATRLEKIHRLRSKTMHERVNAVLDELHGQVTTDTGVLANNFSKIYDSAEALLKENRDQPQGTKKVALQTSVEDAFSGIHEMQAACSIDRADDFSLLLGRILDEQEVECADVLKKVDTAYEKIRKQMLVKMLNSRRRAADTNDAID